MAKEKVRMYHAVRAVPILPYEDVEIDDEAKVVEFSYTPPSEDIEGAVLTVDENGMPFWKKVVTIKFDDNMVKQEGYAL